MTRGLAVGASLSLRPLTGQLTNFDSIPVHSSEIKANPETLRALVLIGPFTVLLKVCAYTVPSNWRNLHDDTCQSLALIHAGFGFCDRGTRSAGGIGEITHLKSES